MFPQQSHATSRVSQSVSQCVSKPPPFLQFWGWVFSTTEGKTSVSNTAWNHQETAKWLKEMPLQLLLFEFNAGKHKHTCIRTHTHSLSRYFKQLNYSLYSWSVYLPPVMLCAYLWQYIWIIFQCFIPALYSNSLIIHVYIYCNVYIL